MLDEEVDHGIGVPHIVVRVEFELFESGVLADQVFNGIFETSDNRRECLPVRWLLHVQHDGMLYTEFLSDR